MLVLFPYPSGRTGTVLKQKKRPPFRRTLAIKVPPVFYNAKLLNLTDLNKIL